MATHYIAMSGSHCCIPDHCQAYDSLQDAVDDLCDLFGLGDTRRNRLTADMYLELTPTFGEESFGAEYCEIQECSCSCPECHNDD